MISFWRFLDSFERKQSLVTKLMSKLHYIINNNTHTHCTHIQIYMQTKNWWRFVLAEVVLCVKRKSCSDQSRFSAHWEKSHVYVITRTSEPKPKGKHCFSIQTYDLPSLCITLFQLFSDGVPHLHPDRNTDCSFCFDNMSLCNEVILAFITGINLSYLCNVSVWLKCTVLTLSNSLII